MDYFFFNKLRFYKKSYDFNAVNLHSFILSRNTWCPSGLNATADGPGGRAAKE